MAAFGNPNPVSVPLHTPGPVWFNAPVTPQTHMPTPGVSRKIVPYGRDEPEIEFTKLLAHGTPTVKYSTRETLKTKGTSPPAPIPATG